MIPYVTGVIHPADLVGAFNTLIGQINAQFALLMTNPTPVLTGIDPTWMYVGSPGDADVSLTAAGSGFVDGASKIRFAGYVEAKTTFVSNTELRLAISRELFTGPNPAVPVSVVTLGGGESNVLYFEIRPLP